jgi:dihydrofolate reductase
MPFGIVVLHALIENDLVDELHLMMFPVVLGTGKWVFGETSDKKRFRLVNSRWSATVSLS